MKKIAVYCGSSLGADPFYKEQAIQLGQEMAKRNITLVYGGAEVGIMGTIADAVLQSGGQAIGVMPKSLVDREICHMNLTELYVVETMHERKQKMMDLADGFIVFPGGAGTMEEFFEVFTWNMIGILNKPAVLLNSKGYYDLLIQFFDKMTTEQFVQTQVREKLLVATTIEDAINKVSNEYKSIVKTF